MMEGKKHMLPLFSNSHFYGSQRQKDKRKLHIPTYKPQTLEALIRDGMLGTI